MWKIWFELFSKKGDMIGAGVLCNEYLRKGNAIRKAQKQFGDGFLGDSYFKWYISKENPWKSRNERGVACEI